MQTAEIRKPTQPWTWAVWRGHLAGVENPQLAAEVTSRRARVAAPPAPSPTDPQASQEAERRPNPDLPEFPAVCGSEIAFCCKNWVWKEAKGKVVKTHGAEISAAKGRAP